MGMGFKTFGEEDITTAVGSAMVGCGGHSKGAAELAAGPETRLRIALQHLQELIGSNPQTANPKPYS